MAEPEPSNEYRNNEPQLTLPGGNVRPSQHVDLERFPAIRRRQQLNALLLQRACTGTETTPVTFEPEDLALLLQMARERDPNGNPALRKNAIAALGQFRSIEAMETLAEIASSTGEHDAMRAQALTSLARVAPKAAPALLRCYLDDGSPLVRQVVVQALAESPDPVILQSLIQLLDREQDVGVRQRASTAVRALGKQLNVRVPQIQIPGRTRGPLSPESES